MIIWWYNYNSDLLSINMVIIVLAWLCVYIYIHKRVDIDIETVPALKK